MATAVKLDPRTGMPKVRVVSPGGPQPATRTLSFVGGNQPNQGPWSHLPQEDQPPWPGTPAPPPVTGPTTTPTGPSPFPGGGGSGVDYRSMVENDPGYLALKAELAAGNISAAQFRTAAVQKALIAFGRTPDTSALDPTTAGFFNQDVTQMTKDLAAKNTAEGLSTTAQLDRAHQIAIAGLQRSLAARGMLESGATGVGLQQEEQRNKEETTSKTRDLLDYLSGQAQAYAQHVHESKMAEAQGLMSTTQGYLGLAGSFGGGASGPPGWASGRWGGGAPDPSSGYGWGGTYIPSEQVGQWGLPSLGDPNAPFTTTFGGPNGMTPEQLAAYRRAMAGLDPRLR